MRLYPRSGQPAQVLALAAVAMVAVVGGVALVVDLSTFLVARQEMQSLADSAALAAVWYPPECDAATYGTTTCDASGKTASDAVQQFVATRGGVANGLCWGTLKQSPPGGQPGPALHRASWEVTLECDPQFMFGRILNLQKVHVRAFATAVLDTIDPTSHEFDSVPQSCNTPVPPGCPAGTLGHAMAHLIA